MTRGNLPRVDLLGLATALGGQKVDHDSNYVSFDLDDAVIEANVKDGAARLRIRANLGHDEPSLVAAWVARQPQPRSGVLQVINHDDGTVAPRLVFERPIHGNDWTTDPLLLDVRDYCAAWATDDDVDSTPDMSRGAFVVRGDPCEVAPASGWLLLGDGAAYPDADELADARNEARVGIFDYLWTAAKQTTLGDVALIYFMAPHKAAHFITRAASNAFFSRDIAVNADGKVADEQRWAYFTHLIEIEPISFKTLQAASDGHLILKGRSGKFLRPETLKALTIRAKDTNDQAELDRILSMPVGLATLPQPDEIDLEVWKAIAPGALPLEAHVSSHLVEPLLRLLLHETPLTWTREHRVHGGSVDFVVMHQGVPTVAIEVKLATPEPPGGAWSESNDFIQLRRYTDELATPGILIDAHRVLLVEHRANQPYLDVARRTVTLEHIEAIRQHLLRR